MNNNFFSEHPVVLGVLVMVIGIVALLRAVYDRKHFIFSTKEDNPNGKGPYLPIGSRTGSVLRKIIAVFAVLVILIGVLIVYPYLKLY